MTNDSDIFFNNMLEEISAFVQPVINIENSLPIGLEVLLRRKENNDGDYSSAETILEKVTSTEQYNAITMRLLDLVSDGIHSVLHQNKIRDNSFISFNVVAAQLTYPHLVSRLIQFQQALPKGITLLIELLEGFGSRLDENIKQAITRLSHTGVTFGIDDFGNDSLCLKYLEALNLDVLKMDISMIGINGGRLFYEKTIQALVYLAEKMNVLLIAEGVETNEQLTLLSECGIQNVQGFYYAKPQPLETLSS